MALSIREAQEADAEAIWQMFYTIIQGRDVFAFPPDMSRADALAFWMAKTNHTYVAVEEDQVVGSYFLRPNQPGLGSHVANGGYMVNPRIRQKGVGRAMCEHSLIEARRLGFRAMQFNYVVSTNHSAVRLWQSLGFQIVGTLPRAFQHGSLGYVDVYVMFQELV